MTWWESSKYKNALQKMDDPCWYFEHMLILRYIKGEPQFFILTEMQRTILEHVKECMEKDEPIRVVLLKGRRIGYSTLMAGLLLWQCTIQMMKDRSDKSWDIISASYLQAQNLFDTTRRMVTFNPLLYDGIQENKGGKRLYSDAVHFETGDKLLKSSITALASGGATKRGRSPDGIVWDEAAQVKDEDYHDLSISALSGDNHEFIGSTPYDDIGFFFDKATDENQGYKVFYFPMAELTDDGKALLEVGDHRKITADMVVKVHGCKKTGGLMTAEEIVLYLQTVDSLTARREVFAEFVSGSELYYPTPMVRSTMYDYVTYPLWKSTKEERDRDFSKYGRFKMGIDWAGAGAHKTCVSVLGWHPDTRQWHEVFWESWIRTKYNDQWTRVKQIYDLFSDEGREIEINCDKTGTQDTNVDALRSMNVPVAGVNFSLPEKMNMARTLYDLMQKNQLRLGWTYDKFDEITIVDSKLKGPDGHLGDWVAAIWCAVKNIRTYQQGNTLLIGGGERVSALDAQRHFTQDRGELRNL